MSLSLRDKIALIYTSAGSQRGVASLVGISHQKVGRILMDAYAPKSRALSDPGLIKAIDLAFSIHKDITRSQARAHGLPYDGRVPVFIQRMPLASGVLGDRVAALHTHWLSNQLRDAWIVAMQQSGKFANASVSSIVNLVVYSKRAENSIGNKYRDENDLHNKYSIENKIIKDMRERGLKVPAFNLEMDRAKNPNFEKERRNITNWLSGHSIAQQVVQGPIYTKYTAMDPRFAPQKILRDINDKLQLKHAPAVGAPGTAMATSVLLQVDTRHGKDKDFRSAHPWPAKPRKARRNKRKR